MDHKLIAEIPNCLVLGFSAHLGGIYDGRYLIEDTANFLAGVKAHGRAQWLMGC